MLADHFDQHFEVRRASTPQDRDEAHRLRFEVYCEDLKYEDAAAFPDGRERDAYDETAEFALIRHRASGRAAGCVRVIVGGRQPERPFPFERACEGRLALQPDAALRARSGEISRLAVHRDFRRRPGEWRNAVPVGSGDDEGGARRHNLLPMGLFLTAAAMGLNLGMDQVFVLMEPRLARLLSTCGLRFDAIGDLVEHHGQRGPFRIDRQALQDGLRDDARDLLDCLCERLP